MRMKTYHFDIPFTKEHSSDGWICGKIAAHSIRKARKLLRTIFRMRALRPGSKVYVL